MAATLRKLAPAAGITGAYFDIHGEFLQDTVKVVFKSAGGTETDSPEFKKPPTDNRVLQVRVPEVDPGKYTVHVQSKDGANSNSLPFDVQSGV
jgi:hypothetical protein